jgi:integrase
MARVYKRKSDGVYWIDYTNLDGERIRESTGVKLKTLAEKCLQSRLEEIVQGKFSIVTKNPSPKFKEFSDNYFEWAKSNKRSWKRDRSLLDNLMPFFGNERLTAIQPLHVENYKIKWKNSVKPATINREVALLKRVLNIAVEWKVINSNPISKVKFLREDPINEVILNNDEADRLIKSCSEVFKPIVITALHTGMRRNEILTLQWKYVDLEKNFITLTNTKNGERRYVFLDETMQKLLSILPANNAFVFVQKNGKPYNWIGRAWRTAKRISGIQCRFHDLRHTFASHLVMNGVDLLTVKELLGHKTLAMVLRYAYLSSKHTQEAIRTLDDSLTVGDGTNLAHDDENEENDTP